MTSVNSTMSAGNFLNTLGVDTHLPYTDGAYFNTKQVLADLKYLGITQVRDALSVSGGQSLTNYEYLAQNGIKFTFLANWNSPAAIQSNLSLIDKFAAAAPGAVTAIEGLNEVNNWPVTWSNGDVGLQAAIDSQALLYSSVKSDPYLKGARVYYFTGYGWTAQTAGPDPISSGLADYDNQHPYPIWGRAPGERVSRASLNNTSSGATPAVFTETGYSTNTSIGGIYGGVSAAVQAKYTLDLLFDAASAGISKTYLYDLLDAYAPGSRQGDDGFGLFDYTGAAKPAATAIHNLTTLLQDSGANAQSYLPQRVDYTISGLSVNGNSLELQKADGTTYIVVWAEPQIWNMTAETEISAPTQNATVSLTSAYKSVQVFDPMVGTAPIASYANASVVNVNVTDHPLLIALSDKATPSGNTSSDPSGSSQSPSGGALTLTYAQYVNQKSALSMAGAYCVNITGSVYALNALINDNHVVAFNLVDAANNLSGSVFSKLGSNTKVQSITVSDGRAIALTYAQYAADAGGLNKLTAGSRVSVSGVSVADQSTLDQDSHVTSFGVSGSGTILASSLRALGDDAKLSSIAIADYAPLVLTLTQYSADGAALAKIAGAYKLNVSGVGLSDLASLEQDSHVSAVGISARAADLLSALPALGKDSKVKSIAISDSSPLNLSYAQYVAGRVGLSKIASYVINLTGTVYDLNATQNDSHVGAYKVSDTASNLSGSSFAQVGSNSKVQSIVVSDGGQVALTCAQYAADTTSLSKLATTSRLSVTGVSVANLEVLGHDDRTLWNLSDTGSNIVEAFDLLNAHAPQVQSIRFTDASAPTLALNHLQADTAADLLKKITSPFILKVSGSDQAAATALNAKIGSNSKLLELECASTDGSHLFHVSGSQMTIPAEHNDTFIVTGHNDTVTFSSAGFGHDVLVGYTVGDKLSFSKSIFASYADLLAHSSGSADITISDTHGDSLTLIGISPSSMTSSMFKFV